MCQAWAQQGYGTPLAIYLAYALKTALYVAGWALACSFSPSLGGPLEIASWWLAPLAFQKAILFSLLFEGLGLGCGSGPLTGRYLPPVAGALHWLRPGTTKLPLFRRAPLIGGHRRTWLDVLVYAALLGALLRALAAPSLGLGELWPIAALVPLCGVLDRTLFLAVRAEHYWVTVVVFVFAGGEVGWVAGAKAVQLALWFFAGFSKLNHHFPSVVGVMTSNAPMTRGTPLRRWVYRDAPNDLRPSRLAALMGHAGTALELAIPLVLLFAPEGPWLVFGVVLACVLHTFITSNVPMGVPIEWNVMVLYGVFALFWAHPSVTVLDVGSGPLAVFLGLTLVVVPIAGNLWPERVSFLLAMRYYAGNWPYSVWLFRGGSVEKLERLTKSSPWVHTQLAHFYDRATSVGLVGKVMGFRLMHLQGRALGILLPRATPDLAACEYADGELVAGLALGWNFGDGHLHHEPLLEAIQSQCDFEPGELRCVFVEAQPLFGDALSYRIHDAASGLVEEGAVPIADLRERQPWDVG